MFFTDIEKEREKSRGNKGNVSRSPTHVKEKDAIRADQFSPTPFFAISFSSAPTDVLKSIHPRDSDDRGLFKIGIALNQQRAKHMCVFHKSLLEGLRCVWLRG